MIIALTPNLAIDRTMRASAPIVDGRMTRVHVLREAAGGKGVNLARTVHALGGECTVAGFVAGWNGRKLRALLAHDGLDGVLVEIPGETRECHIVLNDHGHPTEINEAGPDVPLEAWSGVIDALPAGQVVVGGSLPPGPGSRHGFELVLERLGDNAVVDSSGAALTAALRHPVALIKPNAAELAHVCGTSTAGVEEARALFRRHRVPILLTLGAEGAALIGKTVLRAKAPAVRATNPVGSGDALLGAFLWARQRGYEDDEALRFGVAAGADNARRGGGGRVTSEGVHELARVVHVRRD